MKNVSTNGDFQSDEAELPLEVIGPSRVWERQAETSAEASLDSFLLLFIPLLLFTGGFIGIYVQPPALRAFLRLTGLKPGGGTSSPIAVPVEEASVNQPEQSKIRSVVALGKLVPEGKVITVAPPYGSADARIEEIHVEIGSQVERGSILALLDNRASLESALASAEANVALQKSTLKQTRMTIEASLGEAKAALDRAKAGAELALRDLNRIKNLHAKEAVAQAEVDLAEATYRQANEDVAKAEVTLTRFAAQDIQSQPDVAVAERKLDSAIADLNRAKRDMAKGIVHGRPWTGTVLDIHARPW